METCPHHSWSGYLHHRSARDEVVLHLLKKDRSLKSIHLKIKIPLDINASRHQVESVYHDCLKLDSFQRELCHALSPVSCHCQLDLISQTL